MTRIRLVLLAVGLASAALAVAPASSACGFEERHEVAPGVAWGMHCTRPYVEVFGNEIDPLRTAGDLLP